MCFSLTLTNWRTNNTHWYTQMHSDRHTHTQTHTHTHTDTQTQTQTQTQTDTPTGTNTPITLIHTDTNNIITQCTSGCVLMGVVSNIGIRPPTHLQVHNKESRPAFRLPYSLSNSLMLQGAVIYWKYMSNNSSQLQFHSSLCSYNNSSTITYLYICICVEHTHTRLRANTHIPAHTHTHTTHTHTHTTHTHTHTHTHAHNLSNKLHYKSTIYMSNYLNLAYQPSQGFTLRYYNMSFFLSISFLLMFPFSRRQWPQYMVHAPEADYMNTRWSSIECISSPPSHDTNDLSVLWGHWDMRLNTLYMHCTFDLTSEVMSCPTRWLMFRSHVRHYLIDNSFLLLSKHSTVRGFVVST